MNSKAKLHIAATAIHGSRGIVSPEQSGSPCGRICDTISAEIVPCILHITKHAVERFIERTNSPMALENAKACVIGLLANVKNSDFINWDERSVALRNLFGVFIITAGYVVTFLSWNELPAYQRKLLQNLVIA